MGQGDPGALRLDVHSLELTDEQRGKLIAKAAEDPYFSHVKMARSIGVAGSAGQIRQALATDEAFQEALADARGQMLENAGLGVRHLLTKLAWIVNDDGNSSQLRAVDRAFGFHGIHGEKQHVEITGAGGAPIQVEDRSASLADVARVLEAVGALAELSGGAPRAALPAAPDVLAEPRTG